MAVVIDDLVVDDLAVVVLLQVFEVGFVEVLGQVRLLVEEIVIQVVCRHGAASFTRGQCDAVRVGFGCSGGRILDLIQRRQPTPQREAGPDIPGVVRLAVTRGRGGQWTVGAVWSSSPPGLRATASHRRCLLGFLATLPWRSPRRFGGTTLDASAMLAASARPVKRGDSPLTCSFARQSRSAPWKKIAGALTCRRAPARQLPSPAKRPRHVRSHRRRPYSNLGMRASTLATYTWDSGKTPYGAQVDRTLVVGGDRAATIVALDIRQIGEEGRRHPDVVRHRVDVHRHPDQGSADEGGGGGHDLPGPDGPGRGSPLAATRTPARRSPPAGAGTSRSTRPNG